MDRDRNFGTSNNEGFIAVTRGLAVGGVAGFAAEGLRCKAITGKSFQELGETPFNQLPGFLNIPQPEAGALVVIALMAVGATVSVAARRILSRS